MQYSSIDMSHNAPAEGKSVVGALIGAAFGAIIGAVVLAAVVAVNPSTSLYTATAVRPSVSTVSATLPVNAVRSVRSVASAQYAAQQATQVAEQTVMQTPQGVAVYSWAWVLLAAVAGAVNGLFLWNNRVVMASTTGRREALMAGAAAAGMAAGPAFAAYGDSANVFGKSKDTDQYFEVKGESWSAKMPSKYNPSIERECEGMVARWEDNFDAVDNSFVIVRAGKNSITEYGSLDDVRNMFVTALLGQQAYDGPSISEGGFAPNRFGAASLLEQTQITKNGKTYYNYEILTRSADGNEGGRHQLFSVAASNGKLFIFKLQAGDKRWFMGLERPIKAALASFTVV